MIDEKTLVKNILSGNRRAFEDLIDRYERLVRHIIYDMVADSHEANDLEQEIFIKIYKRLPSFQHKSKLSTWIGKVSYNHCINYLRKKRRLPEFLSEVNLNEIGFTTDEEPSSQTNSKAIRIAMEQLPDQYNLILNLFHLDNFSYEEISDIMRIPEGTVKSRLFRARQKLKEELIKTTDSNEED